MGLLCAGSRFMIELAAMKAGMKDLQVAAVVLAAGGSSRMRVPKQLLPVGGQPMVRRAAEAACAAGLAQVVVVVGAHSEAVTQTLAGLAVEVVVNDAWAGGMSSSMQAGLRRLCQDIRAVVVVLADQPALTPDLIQILVTRYQETEALIVAPFHKGRRGNPVLFDRALFPELLEVEGDRGGRQIILRYQDKVERVEVDDSAVLMDIDTPRDYERLLGGGHDNRSRD
jgi:molybdenum cofactor cytidylyltransferase